MEIGTTVWLRGSRHSNCSSYFVTAPKAEFEFLYDKPYEGKKKSARRGPVHG